jgi:D-alanyl-D-alanine carboxypeptidase
VKNLFLLFLMLVAGLAGFAQSTGAIHETMHGYLKPKGKNPIHSIQIYLSEGDRVFCGAAGFSDGAGEMAEKDNQFKIASITKTMTATVILQMQEEGLLDIEEKAAKYLKDLPFVRVSELSYFEGEPYGDRITLKQLLQHQSGLADIFTDGAFRFYLNEMMHKKQAWSPEKLMDRYYKYRLHKKAKHAPGYGFYYSDVNYFLLGLIIEKLSGQTLAQQFRSRIFVPLGMKNSYFEYYEQAVGNGKMAHSFMGKRNITTTLNTSYDWAGGGVVSTTTDLSQFLEALFDGKLFKNPETLKNMTTMLPHSMKPGKTGFYGLGLYQYQFNGDTYYGHGGFWGSRVAWCPAKRIAFCGSVNQVKPGFNTTEFVENFLTIFVNNPSK